MLSSALISCRQCLPGCEQHAYAPRPTGLQRQMRALPAGHTLPAAHAGMQLHVEGTQQHGHHALHLKLSK